MIFLKPEVKETGVSREIWFALGYAAALKDCHYNQHLTVTSLTDGVHNPGSLHPLGLAADLRTRDMEESQAESFFGDLKGALEPMGYDVVWEGGVGATPATTGAHVHVEFQPKVSEKFFERSA